MLNLLRRGVKTWVAKILFGLLVASFAIWGIGDVFRSGLGSSVATVGDQEISAESFASAVNREMRVQSQRFGQPIDMETARALGLDRQVLSRMAQEAVLDQALQDLALSAPDDQVRELITTDPSFQSQSGGFDQESYRYRIAQAGFSVEEYEEMTRRTLTRSELALALSGGGAAPDGVEEAVYSFQTETMTLSYVTLTGDAHAGEIGDPDEAALKAYHEAHKDQFMDPERRTAVYIHLDLDTLGAEHEPTEEELRALYGQRASIYDLPERRDLYQIVYDSEEQAAADKARIEAGETIFDGLLAARGETRADTSLGEVTAEEIPTAAGEAAFALDAPGVAGPVDTGFGFALVEVAAITPAETVPFEDAKPELAVDLRREAALRFAPEVAGRLDDIRAGGATLEEAASEMGLPLDTATLVARSGDGADGFAADREFLAELFAAETGEERDILETDAGAYFVLRLDEVRAPELRPLDDVRAVVETAWRVEETRKALEAKAGELTARLDAGADLAAIAADLGVEVQTEGPKTRVEGWEALPADAIETLFETGAGATADGLPPGRLDAWTIARVDEVAPGAESDENKAFREQIATQMDRLAGDDALTLYLAAKQAEYGVSVNQQLINSILTR